MKSKLFTGALLALTLFSVGTTTALAKEITKDGNTYHVVESGDTLSQIGDKYDVHFTVLHGNNIELISHADLIEVGQEILVGGKDFDKTLSVAYGATLTGAVAEVSSDAVEQVAESTEQVAVSTQPTSTVAQSDDNWHRANRRMVESTDNYNIGSGNGYIGAYQFHPQTWNSIASQYGLNPNDYSPANQDAMADAYANSRYGGWQNVPTTGGW